LLGPWRSSSRKCPRLLLVFEADDEIIAERNLKIGTVLELRIYDGR
jgi:hypothetical protein